MSPRSLESEVSFKGSQSQVLSVQICGHVTLSGNSCSRICDYNTSMCLSVIIEKKVEIYKQIWVQILPQLLTSLMHLVSNETFWPQATHQ